MIVATAAIEVTDGVPVATADAMATVAVTATGPAGIVPVATVRVDPAPIRCRSVRSPSGCAPDGRTVRP